MEFSTCDFCDAFKSDESGRLRVLPGVYRSYGALTRFAGPMRTVKCFEDNSRVKEAVESPGHGQVLVVDGAGSLRRALLGGNLAAAAAANGWAGLLIHGCVRDLAELAATPLGILALGHVPMPTDRKGQGQSELVLHLHGLPLRPGEWLYADVDGVVVSEQPLHTGS
ncbi:ribonuclease E activity regulator RraA [Paucibacter sp. DJ1R-11]|uniref:ribonuclease E activity regulator RraA n=1 Tax=Paucibacter sp. DJ1R-11 TaxID=2893556 RepID=UPI0021E40C16|nr:ribonuclease E activity regulator RraA [Paucibacter sp. DJ1R-11]MCV2363631.1 ribonuclease E activity regulator RraA [Paucibacter sp. DJ1R-11]